jgi:hypothetical protein
MRRSRARLFDTTSPTCELQKDGELRIRQGTRCAAKQMPFRRVELEWAEAVDAAPAGHARADYAEIRPAGRPFVKKVSATGSGKTRKTRKRRITSATKDWKSRIIAKNSVLERSKCAHQAASRKSTS